MNIFSRIFKVGQAEAHNLVDKIEDPIRMTEQGIRDLKNDLGKSMEALAQVKAQAIAMDRDKNRYGNEAQDWERKAMLLLQRAQSGSMPADEAERLAKEALLKKEDALKRANESSANAQSQHAMVGKLTSQVDKLKRMVSDQENQLVTLKARAKTAGAMKKINKQLSTIDSSSTVSMLERMKEKVDEDEALAQAYGEMEGLTSNLDDQIDNALAEHDSSGDLLLADLKAKLNP